MRQTISGLVAAVAVMAAGAAPAMACGVGCSRRAARPMLRRSIRAAGLLGGCGYGGWAMSGCPIRPCSIIATTALHAVLLRQSGPDLYRSRRVRALSDLSGRRVSAGRLSHHPHHYGYGGAAS